MHVGLRKRLYKYKTKKIDPTVTLAAVCAKFDDICQDCGTPVLLGLHPPRPESATIEHLRTLASGGYHTWDNVTLLCKKCNSNKNRLSQMAALGVNMCIINIFGLKVSFCIERAR